MDLENLIARQLLELLVFVECSLEGYVLDLKGKKDTYSGQLKLMCDDRRNEGVVFKNFVFQESKKYQFDFSHVLKAIEGLYSKTSDKIHATNEKKFIVNIKTFNILDIFALWNVCSYLEQEMFLGDEKKLLNQEQLEEFFMTKGKYSEINLL